jgi:fructose-1,6-bisphosphatase I
MLVYTTGHGLMDLLNPAIGLLFIASKMKFPTDGYSINEGNYVHFPQGSKDYIKYVSLRKETDLILQGT